MPGYILTGSPGAGKTAVLRLLEISGYVVVEEAATDVIALENALGHEEPWSDHSFIDKVITLQRHLLQPGDQPVFRVRQRRERDFVPYAGDATQLTFQSERDAVDRREPA